jgi:hypothetical protein
MNRLAILVGAAISAAPLAAQQRPRLVVVITVDQLRPDYFERSSRSGSF